MNDEERAVWERYVATWTVPAGTDRRALFARCLAPDCVYTDPLTVARGWHELERYMLDFQAQVPGGCFVTEQFMAHHGRSIARWTMKNGEGVAIGTGISYGAFDDEQRLVAMPGFFDVVGGGAPK